MSIVTLARMPSGPDISSLAVAVATGRPSTRMAIPVTAVGERTKPVLARVRAKRALRRLREPGRTRVLLRVRLGPLVVDGKTGAARDEQESRKDDCVQDFQFRERSQRAGRRALDPGGLRV